MDKAPFRFLSRGIPESVEQTPAHLAMLDGRQYIPTTLGDLASRLVDTGEVEPTLEAACDYLMITPEDMQDPEVHFEDEYEAGDYIQRLIYRWKAEYIAAEGPKGKAFDTFLGDRVVAWVNPELRELASEIRAKIAAAPFPQTDEEDRALTMEQLKASAYHSGVAISADQLVEAALSYEGPQAFTTAEIATAALNMLEDYCHYRGLEDDTKVSDIVLGADQIGEFRSNLAWIFGRNTERYAESRFDRVKHLFLTPNIEDHFLSIGGEK